MNDKHIISIGFDYTHERNTVLEQILNEYKTLKMSCDISLEFTHKRNRLSELNVRNYIDLNGIEGVAYHPYYYSNPKPELNSCCDVWISDPIGFDWSQLGNKVDQIKELMCETASPKALMFVTAFHPLKEEGNSIYIRQWLRVLKESGYNIHIYHYLYDKDSYSEEINDHIDRYCDKYFAVPVETRLVGDNRNGLNVHVDDWCGIELLDWVLELNKIYHYQYCLVNYSFFSGVFTALSDSVLKILITHDIFIDRNKKMLEQGYKESGWMSIDRDGEILACSRADKIVAIQSEEAEKYARLLGDNSKIVTIPMVMKKKYLSAKNNNKKIRIGYCGSSNWVNEINIGEFIERWLEIPELSETTEIIVAGGVSKTLKNFIEPNLLEHPGILLMGRVENIEDFYSFIDIVVNPERGGSGLKIKTIEGLSYGLPLLSTKAGMAGLQNDNPLWSFPDIEHLVSELRNLIPNIQLGKMADETKTYYSSFFSEAELAMKTFIESGFTTDKPLERLPLEQLSHEDVEYFKHLVSYIKILNENIIYCSENPSVNIKKLFEQYGSIGSFTLVNDENTSDIKILSDSPLLLGHFSPSSFINQLSTIKDCIKTQDKQKIFFSFYFPENSISPTELVLFLKDHFRFKLKRSFSGENLHNFPLPIDQKTTWLDIEIFSEKEKEESLVSVIIPCYNVEKYIEQCLDSVISQTYTNIEILLVNDCSPDFLDKIIQLYASLDNRLAVITHEVNKGLGPSRETGLNLAKGDYVFYLDSDDYLEHNAIELLIKTARKNNSDMVAGSAASFWDETGEMFDFDRKFDKGNADLFGIVDSLESFRGCFCYPQSKYVPLRAWGILFRKGFLDSIPLTFPALEHEDIPVIPIYYYNAKNPYYCNDILVYYRQREESLSNSDYTKRRLHRWIELWNVMKQRMLNYNMENQVSDVAIYFSYHLFWKIERHKDDQELLQETIQIFIKLFKDIKKPDMEYFYGWLFELLKFVKTLSEEQKLEEKVLSSISNELLISYYEYELKRL